MHKKVVILGGGHGSSAILSGLKDFPVDITAVISVSDNGKSTGKLRDEFKIPAVGDIRKVISNLSSSDKVIRDMLEYRFNTFSDLNGHSVGNLILTAMMDMTGSLKDSIKYLSTLLDVRHTVLPISEDHDITLMGETVEGDIIEGEAEITEANRKYKRIFYKKEPKVVNEVLDAINEADLVIISMGSLYTSILPHIMCKDVNDALEKSKAKIMYICNAVTQPGETDDFGVSDHIKLLNSYLGKRKIDAVIASNTKINQDIAEKYANKEQKDPIVIDKENVDKLKVELIVDDLVIVKDGLLRHDSVKLALIILSYLLREKCHTLQ